MCVNPDGYVYVKRGPKWVKIPRPCDDCWQCRENYESDWVGRSLCEAAHCTHTCAVSFTYATPLDPKDISHKVLNPRHFQLFVKRLRNAGHRFKYLVAGEYGELAERAHFHAILFFKVLVKNDRPVKLENRDAFLRDPSIAAPFSRQVPQDQMCHVEEWPHGHIKADWSMSEKAIRYVCKYFLKDDTWHSMSKKPPIGWEWFAEKAAKNRDLGVLPNSFEYLPPGGKPGKVYLMTGATRRDFLTLIKATRAERPRMSKWLQASFDKMERQAFADERISGFDDEGFLARQGSPDKARSRIVLDKLREKVADDNWTKVQAAAWGFEDVEEFEAFAEAGGCQAHPEYFQGVPEHVQGSACNKGPGRSCSCQECQGLRAKAAAAKAHLVPPTGHDRQGRPYWGEPGREYIAEAFAPRQRPVDDGAARLQARSSEVEQG